VFAIVANSIVRMNVVHELCIKEKISFTASMLGKQPIHMKLIPTSYFKRSHRLVDKQRSGSFEINLISTSFLPVNPQSHTQYLFDRLPVKRIMTMEPSTQIALIVVATFLGIFLLGWVLFIIIKLLAGENPFESLASYVHYHSRKKAFDIEAARGLQPDRPYSVVDLERMQTTITNALSGRLIRSRIDSMRAGVRMPQLK
jgi:hypothetical protein